MKPGAMLLLLDPAAPHGGELPRRDDISIFVCHPCHPPIVNDETDPEARMDFSARSRLSSTWWRR